ncbi:MAG: arylesterase [Gemmatimonadetes bacterium]|nr:arylesterase [Gemmatimonadota bacterium]
MSICRVVRGFALATALVPLIIGCGGGDGNSAPAAASPPATAAAPKEQRHGDSAVVLFLGTSLTAGLGVDPDDAYPARVQAKIDSAGIPFRVVNAGSSGETSAGALRRLDWLLRQPFDVLVLETGANDMLRGSDPDSTRANLEAIIRRVRAARPGTQIVLVGMMALPNLGREYGAKFQAIYPDLARKYQLPLIPFLLEKVAGKPSLNLPDGMHPNETGHRLVAQTVWAGLEPILRARVAARGGGTPAPRPGRL